MRRLFPLLTMLVWGLWFGGLMGVLVSVIAIAKANPIAVDPTVFDASAPAVFHAFEGYQLVLSVLATLFVLVSFAVTRGRAHLIVLGLFWAATIAALGSTLFVTPQIDRMRVAKQTQTAEFKQAHARSGWLYSGEAVALLVAGLVLPVTFRDEEKRKLPRETVATPDPAAGLRV